MQIGNYYWVCFTLYFVCLRAIPDQLVNPVSQVPLVSQESVERGETLVMMDYLELL